MISKFLGACILGSCLTLVYLFETANSMNGVFRIFHWPAMILTGLGPLGLALLCAEWSKIKETLSFLTQRSPADWEKTNQRETAVMQQLSEQFYAIGTKAVDKVDKTELSLSLIRILERISMRIPVQDVRELVEKERDRTIFHLSQSIKTVNLAVRLAPSIGMLGTILGMVQLLSSLRDPSHIGSHMSLALLTTFYGLFFSLVIWTPLQNRLEALRDIRLNGFDQILHWLELLERRKPLQYFEENLNALGLNKVNKRGADKEKKAAQPVSG